MYKYLINTNGKINYFTSNSKDAKAHLKRLKVNICNVYNSERKLIKHAMIDDTNRIQEFSF